MSEGPSVVGRSAALLRELSRHTADGATTTTAARGAGVPRATAHRLLEALAVEGLVDRDARTGHWFLGPEIYVLGRAATARYDVTEEARSSVLRLARETGESAFFSVRRADEVVVLLREDGDFPIRSYVLYEGARFPLGTVSAGIAVLAHLPDAEVDAYLARADLVGRWGREFSDDAVRGRLAATREDGWSLNPGLIVEGSWGMAAAVFTASGTPEYALTITGIEPRFRRERQAALGRLLLEETHRLTRSMR
ncbi:IclR family transcriptional regulator [Actinocorallia sp. A-T 12471]|uniref:IclR family transcriptional regulator n=1 Tax=Actinocorallia sp. A-T 12471 TaxID=3089813 RepID=UPI0029CFB42C|nr:IclR family transcriptional regulator [Actinocorallia sp. A-T 12471]MDX6740228.1 IclR family transcriptional regulator [Actinocorallia sp. A-T 12471]